MAYSSLQQLLREEEEAMRFFDGLPEEVREDISKRARHVNSLRDLKAMARAL